MTDKSCALFAEARIFRVFTSPPQCPAHPTPTNLHSQINAEWFFECYKCIWKMTDLWCDSIFLIAFMTVFSSLQPCMHTFCAACYSGWMERSSLCPTCRCPVERICKNHILNNLVEAYLIQHPGKLYSVCNGI